MMQDVQPRPDSSVSGPSPDHPLWRYRFGAHFVNSQEWHLIWGGYDGDQVARDMDSMVEMNLDHFRIFAIWPYFQPWRNVMDLNVLQRLDRLMGLAEQRNLDVCVAMLTGWTGHGSARPIFDRRADLFYTSPKEFDAQTFYFDEVANVLKNHGNFLGFDLGNEMNACWNMGEATGPGDAWMEKMMAHVNGLCPNQVHVNGVDHQPWFLHQTFSPQALVRLQKMVPIHCYNRFTGALDRGGPLDAPSVKLIAGMAALARAYGHAQAKPIWAQEFGVALEWMDPQIIPRFTEQTIRAAMDEGVSWFTWYSSHDTPRKFAGLGDDYSMGLMTQDYHLKPAAHVYKEMARQYAGKPVTVPTGKSLPPLPAKRTMESTWKWLMDWMG